MALYDLLLTAVLLVALLRFLRSPRAAGSAIALFTLWYAGGRVLMDLLRTDPRLLLGLTGSQLTSILAIAAVLTALWLRARRSAPPEPAWTGHVGHARSAHQGGTP